MAENSVQDLMELLDTDYDGQDTLFSSRLDMRDRIRQEQKFSEFKDVVTDQDRVRSIE